MPKDNNPFKPTSPVYRGVFSGRLTEIERIETVMVETKNSNPTNLLIIGERGIGKTSLLLLSKFYASGDILIDDIKLNFLPVLVSLDKRTTIPDLARKIKTSIERSMRSSKNALQYMKDIWGFLQNIEICSSKLGIKRTGLSESELFDNFTFSIIDTVKAITNKDNALNKLNLTRPMDGIIIFIDEADNASKELDLGTFLKHLSEQIVAENCNNVLIIMAGLPDIRNILLESHPSSLRMFEEIELFPLSISDVKNVIQKGIEEANTKNSNPVTITEEALNWIFGYSEGYPHFVQQFGYSSYAYDTDYNIDKTDVDSAAFLEGGAYDLIGDRYYKDMYFKKIRKDSYRQVLKIMSELWNQWVPKQYLRERFKGKETTLNNAIRALADRNVILRKPGIKGEYRLQWVGFAFWIKHFAKALEERIGSYNGKSNNKAS